MPEINTPAITLYLTSKYSMPKLARKVGETGAGFMMKGFDLKGKTGVKSKWCYTEGLNACLGGVVLGKKLNNLFHENSSIYADAEGSKKKIFAEITNKLVNLTNNTREKIHVMLFGGWGYGSNLNKKEVQISHNLFNNTALCVEDIIPETEGIEVPLTTIWGKLDSSTPDSVHVRENTVVLVNDIFKSLFKNGKCELTRDGIINFLKNHYEEVQIPDEVKIIPMEKYNPLEICQNNLTRKKINLSV